MTGRNLSFVCPEPQYIGPCAVVLWSFGNFASATTLPVARSILPACNDSPSSMKVDQYMTFRAWSILTSWVAYAFLATAGSLLSLILLNFTTVIGSGWGGAILTPAFAMCPPTPAA